MGMGNDLVGEARKRARMTQRELAEKAGTTQSAIARLESGKTAPSFDQVLRLVRLCGMDVLVNLQDYDGSDWAQAQRLRDLTASERVARSQRVAAQMRKFRKAGERSA